MPIDPTRESWKPGMPWEQAIEDIAYIRGLAEEMGGPERIERQHAGGRYTIRERVEKFVDPGSFFEAGPLVGAAEYDDDGNLRSFNPGGYVMGLGEIDGRPIAIGGHDFTRSGGSPHDVQKGPAQFSMPLASQYGIPYVQLVEGVGHSARSDETRQHMALSTGDGYWRLAEVLRTVPVATGIMGSTAGAPAAHAMMTHFSVMVKEQSQIFPSGPQVVRRSLGEQLTKDELGGAAMHVHRSGQVDNEADSEEDAFDQIKQFLSYLPDTTNDVAPRVETGDPPERRAEELLAIMPRDRRAGYDIRRLVGHVVDNGQFFEMRRYYGGSIMTAFARLDGYSVGILASDPMVVGGSLTADASDKYAHFVDLCDAFNLPMIIFLDMPGFMIGSHSESQASMRRGARALIASAEAKVPKVLFAIRKAYGVGAGVPNSIGVPAGVNLRFGWPSGEWGGIPIEGGVAASYAREIAAAADPEAHQRMIEERIVKLRSPFRSAHHFDVTDLIDPRDTRALACRFVRLAQPALARLAKREKRAVRP